MALAMGRVLACKLCEDCACQQRVFWLAGQALHVKPNDNEGESGLVPCGWVFSATAAVDSSPHFFNEKSFQPLC